MSRKQNPPVVTPRISQLLVQVTIGLYDETGRQVGEQVVETPTRLFAVPMQGYGPAVDSLVAEYEAHAAAQLAG